MEVGCLSEHSLFELIRVCFGVGAVAVTVMAVVGIGLLIGSLVHSAWDALK